MTHDVVWSGKFSVSTGVFEPFFIRRTEWNSRAKFYGELRPFTQITFYRDL